MSEQNGTVFSAGPETPGFVPGNPIDANISRRVTKIPTGFNNTEGMDITSDSGYFSVWTSQTAGSVYQVSLHDPQASPTKVATMPVGPSQLAVAGGSATVPATAYVASWGTGQLWRVPLTGEAMEPPSLAATGMPGAYNVALDGQNNAYVSGLGGDVWRVDLDAGSPHLIASGLGQCCGIAYDPAGSCLYVTDNPGGKLWKVPLTGQKPRVVATGMFRPDGVTLRVEADPTAAGGHASWAYVTTSGDGKLWRISTDASVAIPVSEDINLSAVNLGNGRSVHFDDQGNAYAASWDVPWLWRIAGLSTPSGSGQGGGPVVPVVVKPRASEVMAVSFVFSGTVTGTVPSGSTLHAVDETGLVIADGVTINADTSWSFLRTVNGQAADWAPGSHSVTVTVRSNGLDIGSATVAFTVQASTSVSRQVIIKTPAQNGVTGATPDFTGTVPTPVPTGTTVSATDETGQQIALNIKVNQTTGYWLFDRDSKTGPWTAGEHKVTVTASPDNASSGPATVTFNVTAPSLTIATPRKTQLTGSTPYFTGTSGFPANAGYTINARDADIVIAENWPIKTGGNWDFVRLAKYGPWEAGHHFVTVTVRDKGGKDVASTTVEFNTRGYAADGPTIKTPSPYGTTGDVPDFSGNMPKLMAEGVTIHAVDENNTVIAETICIKPDGTWIFNRDRTAGPWTRGTWHTVNIYARDKNKTEVTGINTITFYVKQS